MSYSQQYRTLANVQVLHEYYLNNGPDSFRGMDADQQQLMFKNYAFNGFLQVIPTEQTRRILENQKLLLRTNPAGLQVLAQVEPAMTNEPATPFISIDNNLELQFLVKIGDPAFEIYTDLSWGKDEIFFFSNIKPAGSPPDFPPLPVLPDQEDEPQYITNAYRLDDTLSKNILDNMQVSREDRIGLLGVLVLRMHGINSITDDGGEVPADPITFVMEFANRSTIWKYYFQNSDYYAETTNPKPLTKNGYIVINPSQLTLRNKNPEMDPGDYVFDLNPYYYPAPEVRKTEIEAGNFYSVIYI